MIEVRESTAEKFAELFAGRATAEQFAAVGGWFFEAFHNAKSSGGFWVIPKPAGAELHTELRLRGREALEAAEQLKTILASRYHVSRLTTYAENRKVRIAAVIAGFKKVCEHNGRTYFEQWLPTSATTH